MSLIEMMIALLVLSIGILAIAQIFPAGSRTQLQNRMLSTASFYAQQKIEQLGALWWNDPALSVGRHPAGSIFDTLGTSKAWLRYYDVTQMASPLDDLKRVAVHVSWGSRSVTDTAYVRR